MNNNDLSVCVVSKLEVSKLRWFTFDQNNSGGRYEIDNKVDAYVIIQAHNADEANALAERIGIYFNGVDEGHDCECCGDRWYPVRNSEASDEPMVSGEPVTWSPDAVLTSKAPGRRFGLADGVKVYPYSVLVNC